MQQLHTQATSKYEDDPVYHMPFPTFNCPKCGDVVKIVGGKECKIKGIRLVA